MPNEVYEVLERAWDEPFAIASNFAREYLRYVALAASLGWISSIRPDGRDFSTRWHITASGNIALTAFHQPPTEV